MFPFSEEPDLFLLQTAHEYLLTQSLIRNDEREILINAGTHAVIPLLSSALSIFQDKIKGKSKEDAERIAKPLTILLPRDINEIIYEIDGKLRNSSSISDTAKMLMNGEVGAINHMFYALIHYDFGIRFIAGLTLLENKLLPPLGIEITMIKNEGQKLMQYMKQDPHNPKITTYNMTLCIYSAIIYRAQDSDGVKLLQAAKILFDDTAEERNRSLDQFIEVTLKDLVGYTLFCMNFNKNE
jgi:hypothetical protein